MSSQLVWQPLKIHDYSPGKGHDKKGATKRNKATQCNTKQILSKPAGQTCWGDLGKSKDTYCCPGLLAKAGEGDKL